MVLRKMVTFAKNNHIFRKIVITIKYSTTMKKLLTGWMIALLALVSFTSCEDEEIAYDLEGTWEGRVFDYSDWDGKRYNISRSLIEFYLGAFRLVQGDGHWVDFYSGGPRDYVSYKIHWRVDNQVIYITFKEDGTQYRVSNYRLSETRFSGTMYEYKDGKPLGYSHDFELRHTSSPNWNNYYSDYDYYWSTYGYRHYWSNDATFETEDGSAVTPAQEYSTTTVPMAPKRHLIDDTKTEGE